MDESRTWRGSRSRRALAVLLVAVAVAAPTAGCAAAARLLSAAELVSAADDLLGSAPTGHPIDRTSGSTVRAVVVGTGDDGLRLRAVPGGHHRATLSDGTSVTAICREVGPDVPKGPHGPTTAWDRVRTPSGDTGYMSEAYLDVDAGGATLPAC